MKIEWPGVVTAIVAVYGALLSTWIYIQQPEGGPELHFQVRRQNEDGTLVIHVTNTGTVPSVVGKLEYCSSPEDCPIYHRENWPEEPPIYDCLSAKARESGDVEEAIRRWPSLLGFASNPRYGIFGMNNPSLRVLEGELGIPPNGYTLLLFEAPPGIRIETLVESSSAGGRYHCPLELVADNYRTLLAPSCKLVPETALQDEEDQP